jgi:hypothetical protein
MVSMIPSEYIHPLRLQALANDRSDHRMSSQ